MKTTERPTSTFSRAQQLLLAAGAGFILLAIVFVYLIGGASSADTQVQYTLDLTQPASGNLSVSLTLLPGPQPFVDLYLRDPILEGRSRISTLHVERNGSPLPHWQALPGNTQILRIWNGFSTSPLTLTYKVDPTWSGSATSLRAYLGKEYAYLPGSTSLYTPVSLRDLTTQDYDQPGIDSGFAVLDAILPTGWQMVSPFGSQQVHISAAYLRSAYFAFGPFELQDLLYDKTAFLLGVYQGLDAQQRAAFSNQIPLLFGTMREMAGFVPVSHTCYFALAVLPGNPLSGSLAGTGSLVTQEEILPIAQQMFHWWNGDTLTSIAEAGWLKEGFSAYYAAKALRDSGIWDDARFSRAMEDYAVKVYGGSSPHPLNLIQAAVRLEQQQDATDRAITTYGGALLAAALDQQLAVQGRSLDQIWPVLAALQHPVTPKDFTDAVEKLGGSELAQTAAAILEGRATIP